MSVLSMLCVGLVLNLDLTRVRAQAPPQEYVLRIERIETESTVMMGQSFRENDLLMCFLPAARPLFPCRVTKMQIWWQRPAGQYRYPVKVEPLLYDADGSLRYDSDIAVLSPGGLNQVPLTRTWWYDESPENQFLTPAIFDEPPVSFQTGIYGGFRIDGEVDRLMSENSPNIVCSTEGPWELFNILGRNGSWYLLEDEGLPGNLGIRLVVEPLCPAKIGDMPVWNGSEWEWDGDIDQDDRVILQDQINAFNPTDPVFDDYRVYMDLDNDGDLDADDMAILDGHFTGSGNVVICPRIDIVTPLIEQTAPTGVRPADTTFQVRNSGGCTLDFTVQSTAFWLGVSPTQASSTGQTQDFTLSFDTESLGPGSYPAWLRVDGNAGNSPQWAHVVVTIGTEGDLDRDGDVDPDDVDLFEKCATGPGLSYDPESLAIGCTLIPDGDGIILADLDRDGDVDQADFAQLQVNYGSQSGMALATGRSASKSPFGRLADPADKALSRIPLLTSDPKANGAPDVSRTPGFAAGVKPVSDQYPADCRLRAPTFDEQGAKENRPQVNLNLVFGIIIVIAVLLLAYLLWGWLHPAGFFANSTYPTSTEAQRIRAAIDRLNSLGNPDSNRAFAELLGSDKWYNAEVFGGIVLNRQPPADVSLRASVFKASKNIAVHESLVNTPVWDDNALKILAVALFAEWQHTDEPQMSENECQTWLEQWLQQVGWNDLNLPFHHGTNEACQDD
jgi:hypothetical protein